MDNIQINLDWWRKSVDY